MDNIKVTDAGLLMQANSMGSSGAFLAIVAAVYMYFFSVGIISALILVFGLWMFIEGLRRSIRVEAAQQKFINQGK